MRSTIIIVLLLLISGGAWVMRDDPAVQPFVHEISDYTQKLRHNLDANLASLIAVAKTPRSLDDARLQQLASDYVEELSTPKSEPLTVEQADHFVGRDQIITLAQSGTVIRLTDQNTATSGADKNENSYESGIVQLTLLGSSGDDPVVEQITNGSLSITLADILKETGNSAPDSIYYVRTVQKNDYRGIWGIVVDGLTENFAKGIAIRRNEEVGTYRVDIPEKSDHALADKTSSFLGRLIDRKTRDSHVYNFTENKMGRNPDLIYPGQELVIVDFEPQELVAIYRYFVEGEQ